MELYWEDLLSKFQTVKHETEIFQIAADEAGQLGFEYCCYGIRMPVPVSNPAVKIFETYPEGWMQHYQKNRFINIDPTVILGARYTFPIIWSDKLFSSSPSAEGLWKDAKDHGVAFGISQSSWAAHGAFGLLSLARKCDRLTDSESVLISRRLFFLSSITHQSMSRLLIPQLAPETVILLTHREREVLRWTSDGKTSSEIGKILSISDRTVNFHVNNTLIKLSATNKLQAVVKALIMGLID